MLTESIESSPRPWGCFRDDMLSPLRVSVFPTPVGVFPRHCGTVSRHTRLPHARGGVSAIDTLYAARCTSSPRPWGCFRLLSQWAGHLAVFPTPVGVFLRIYSFCTATLRLPHARGGVSVPMPPGCPVFQSSPRPWGCFFARLLSFDARTVFPTPVGVFPHPVLRAHPFRRLPHARGGVSPLRCGYHTQQPSSPRPWGCFRPASSLPP